MDRYAENYEAPQKTYMILSGFVVIMELDYFNSKDEGINVQDRKLAKFTCPHGTGPWISP